MRHWLSRVCALVAQRGVKRAGRSVCEEARGESEEVVVVWRPPLSAFQETRALLNEPLSEGRWRRAAFEEPRWKRFGFRKPLASSPKVRPAPRRVSLERRGERFDGENVDLEPWSPCDWRPSAFEETLRALGPRPVKRFDGGKPLAQRLSRCAEWLSAFAEPRWKRFATEEPLAAPRSAFGQPRWKRFATEEPLAAPRSAFGQPRWKRFATEEPLAAPRSAFGQPR